MLRGLAAGLALLIAAPAAAQPMPGMLSIDEGTPVRVASAAALRRALARCTRPNGCRSVYLETCQMCILSARAERGGFSITTRLGPPGPEFQLFDNRPGPAGTRSFVASEMIEIFAAYIAGDDDPLYVGTTPIQDETTQ